MADQNEIEEIKLLAEIKETLKATNISLEQINFTLGEDRKMMWRILGLTIAGAFAIIGIKIMFP